MGHPLAAAGAIEAVIATLAIEQGFIPANTGCIAEPDLGLSPVSCPSTRAVRYRPFQFLRIRGEQRHPDRRTQPEAPWKLQSPAASSLYRLRMGRRDRCRAYGSYLERLTAGLSCTGKLPEKFFAKPFPPRLSGGSSACLKWPWPCRAVYSPAATQRPVIGLFRNRLGLSFRNRRFSGRALCNRGEIFKPHRFHRLGAQRPGRTDRPADPGHRPQHHGVRRRLIPSNRPSSQPSCSPGTMDPVLVAGADEATKPSPLASIRRSRQTGC